MVHATRGKVRETTTVVRLMLDMAPVKVPMVRLMLGMAPMVRLMLAAAPLVRLMLGMALVRLMLRMALVRLMLESSHQQIRGDLEIDA